MYTKTAQTTTYSGDELEISIDIDGDVCVDRLRDGMGFIITPENLRAALRELGVIYGAAPDATPEFQVGDKVTVDPRAARSGGAPVRLHMRGAVGEVVALEDSDGEYFVELPDGRCGYVLGRFLTKVEDTPADAVLPAKLEVLAARVERLEAHLDNTDGAATSLAATVDRLIDRVDRLEEAAKRVYPAGTRLRDNDGDVWTVGEDGKLRMRRGDDGDSLESVSRFYGPLNVEGI